MTATADWWSRAIAAQLRGRYRWGQRDCVALIERAHAITRPAYMLEPEPIATRIGLDRHGSLAAAYEHWLTRWLFRQLAPDEPDRPGDVAVLRVPLPAGVTLGLVDGSYQLRYRADDRMITCTGRHRILSRWRRKGW